MKRKRRRKKKKKEAAKWPEGARPASLLAENGEGDTHRDSPTKFIISLGNN